MFFCVCFAFPHERDAAERFTLLLEIALNAACQMATLLLLLLFERNAVECEHLLVLVGGGDTARVGTGSVAYCRTSCKVKKHGVVIELTMPAANYTHHCRRSRLAPQSEMYRLSSTSTAQLRPTKTLNEPCASSDNSETDSGAVARNVELQCLHGYRFVSNHQL